MQPDERRNPRIKDPNLLAYLKVEYDCCEITGVVYDLHLHHVLFRSHGGDDVRSNIVCLHDDLHELYHRRDTLARLRVAEHIANNRPDVMSYLAMKLGTDARDYWLEGHGLSI